MVGTVFGLIAVAELVLLVSTIQLWRRHPDRVLPLLMLVVAALIWDNAVIAAGRPIGAGGVLEGLSVPRFVTHALLVPLLILVGAGLGRGYRVRWLAGPVARWGFGGLTLLMIAIGVWQDIVSLDLEPAYYADTVRYTNAAATGPPIPAIVAIWVLLAVGVAVLVRARWPWLLAGSATMLVAAGAGVAVPWLGNLGELVLTASLWQTAAHLEPPVEERVGREQAARVIGNDKR
ncbi:hypothetical protein L3i22_020590 [Actinoplanes sp. L3-i22]|nr:hypothetical protein L3i22_020590 [Actinoplanes sp. L3-i22]